MAEFKSYGDIKKEGRRKRVILLLSVVTCVLAGGTFAFWKNRRPSNPAPLPNLARQVIDARGAAQYDRALQLVAEGQKRQPAAPAIKTLSEEFQQNLQPDIRLHCLKYGVPLSSEPKPASCQQLTPADKFYFTVSLVDVPRPCYAYLFLVDSAGDWTAVFPNKFYAPNANPLARALYQVPDNIDMKLQTPDTPGAETLFAVAAYWRIDALEDLAAALASEVNLERRRNIGQQVLARLRLEDAAAAGIPGLAFGREEFHNSGRPSVQDVATLRRLNTVSGAETNGK